MEKFKNDSEREFWSDFVSLTFSNLLNTVIHPNLAEDVIINGFKNIPILADALLLERRKREPEE